MTDFALVPDHGPARLVRFVNAEDMPDDNIIAMLDAPNNLLFVNRDAYDLLAPFEQRQVIQTRRAYIETSRLVA